MPARTRWTTAWRGFGGFDHNAQALRIVTRLERRYAGFDGLNLTWETLEGLVKHNGPLLDADGAADRALCRDAAFPARSSNISARQDLELVDLCQRRGAGRRDRRRHRLQCP